MYPHNELLIMETTKKCTNEMYFAMENSMCFADEDANEREDHGDL